MKLRLSIFAAIVATSYAIGAGLLAAQEAVGQGCMGWCYMMAAFPESLLLVFAGNELGYSKGWQGGGAWLFAFLAIGFNAFVLYVMFGGVAWWRGWWKTGGR
jgi:hypothetical protein